MSVTSKLFWARVLAAFVATVPAFGVLVGFAMPYVKATNRAEFEPVWEKGDNDVRREVAERFGDVKESLGRIEKRVDDVLILLVKTTPR